MTLHPDTHMPHATPGPIDDRALEALIGVAQTVSEGRACTEAEASFLLVSMGPLLEELRDYRQRATEGMEAGHEFLGVNVVRMIPQGDRT